MKRYKIHTLRKTFEHKGFEIECILTQTLINNYADHGHYNMVFMDKKTGDVLYAQTSFNGPPHKIESLDAKIDDFKHWDNNVIDNPDE